MARVFNSILFTIIFGFTLALDVMIMDEGSGMSFIELWEQTGLSIDDSGKGIYRNTLLDRNFTQGCPSRVSLRWLLDTESFVIRCKEPFANNTLAGVIASTSIILFSSQPFKEPIVVQAKPEEDVIFKGFAKNDEDDIFVAVYFPKNTTGYPKYYVKPYDQINVSLGNIPGNEHLYNQFKKLKVSTLYMPDCFADTTTVAVTTNPLDNNGNNTIIEGQTTFVTEVTSSTYAANTMPRFCNKDNRVCNTCFRKSANDQTAVTTSQPVWTITTHSSIECCIRCYQDDNMCKSVFFTQSTNTCIGLNHVENSLDQQINAVHLVPYKCIIN